MTFSVQKSPKESQLGIFKKISGPVKSITESQTDESVGSSYHRALQLKIDYPGTMSLLDSNRVMSQVDSYGAIGDNDSNEGNGAVSTENCDIGNFDSNGANKGIPLSLNERNSAVSTKNCDISDFDSNSANITVLTSLNEGSSANSTKICDTTGDSNGANDKSSIDTENCDIGGWDMFGPKI